jgi:hypothetical protein
MEKPGILTPGSRVWNEHWFPIMRADSSQPIGTIELELRARVWGVLIGLEPQARCGRGRTGRPKVGHFLANRLARAQAKLPEINDLAKQGGGT